MHVGALAWNGGLAFAMLYYVFPRIYGTRLYSLRLANVHFWLATLGILFYAIPMYVGGITQSLMWQEFTPDGVLRYPNFLETVVRLRADVRAARRRRHALHRSAPWWRSTTCIARRDRALSWPTRQAPAPALARTAGRADGRGIAGCSSRGRCSSRS